MSNWPTLLPLLHPARDVTTRQREKSQNVVLNKEGDTKPVASSASYLLFQQQYWVQLSQTMDGGVVTNMTVHRARRRLERSVKKRAWGRIRGPVAATLFPLVGTDCVWTVVSFKKIVSRIQSTAVRHDDTACDRTEAEYGRRILRTNNTTKGPSRPQLRSIANQTIQRPPSSAGVVRRLHLRLDVLTAAQTQLADVLGRLSFSHNVFLYFLHFFSAEVSSSHSLPDFS